MYRNFFGFSENPFEVTPDPSFLYLSRSHQEIFTSLNYGIVARRGFIVILGEVGTGKTTLLSAILDKLDDNHKVAYIFNTDVSFEEMLGMALVDLEILRPEETLDKVEAIHRLNDFAIQQLAEGGNVVFIIDEAQNLNQRSLENLRLLSNLETPKHKLIQIVLSGQPELERLLKQREMRQLSQRVSIKRYLQPLNERETYEYIRHRLVKSNCKNPSLFNQAAQQLIWQYSQGIPRKINNICDNALLIGYGLQKTRIRSYIVEKVIEDLGWSPMPEAAATPAKPKPSKKTKRPGFALRLAWAASLMFFGGFILLIGMFLGGTQINFPGMNKTEHAGLINEPDRAASPSLETGLSRATRQPAGQNSISLEKDEQERLSVVRKPLSETPALTKKQPGPQPEQSNVEIASVLEGERAPSSVFADSLPDWDFSGISFNKIETDLRASVPRILKSHEKEAVPQTEKAEEMSPQAASQFDKAEEMSPQVAYQPEEPEEMSPQAASQLEKAEEMSPQAASQTEKADEMSPQVASQPEEPEEMSPQVASRLEEPEKMSPKVAPQPEEPAKMSPPIAGTPSVVEEQKLPPKQRTVVAKRGDTLTSIIIKNYGEYSEDKLLYLLQKNPEIRNPNWILEGQVLKLPGLK